MYIVNFVVIHVADILDFIYLFIYVFYSLILDIILQKGKVH